MVYKEGEQNWAHLVTRDGSDPRGAKIAGGGEPEFPEAVQEVCQAGVVKAKELFDSNFSLDGGILGFEFNINFCSNSELLSKIAWLITDKQRNSKPIDMDSIMDDIINEKGCFNALKGNIKLVITAMTAKAQELYPQEQQQARSRG